MLVISEMGCSGWVRGMSFMGLILGTSLKLLFEIWLGGYCFGPFSSYDFLKFSYKGIKGYVKVQNKQDTVGIGLEKPNDWAFDTTQFDNILKRLCNVTGLEKKKPLRWKLRLVSVVIILIQFLKLLDLKEDTREERGKLVSEYSLKDLEGILRRCCIATFGALNVEYLFQVNFAVASSV
ncbi:hypothetical protein K1719_028612 [Acacia pycnantha]|nr:hypothetical protein K1719_028612 [Acacia pycnantha]